MHDTKPIALVILDGFGFRKEKKYNAVAQAKTPNLDAWFANYPHALLQASGKAVGLLEGMIGNSEVGHMTIGAGRIIEQPVSIINRAIDNKSFFRLPLLTEKLRLLKKTEKTLHLMGLLSDAGVHSHEKDLFAFLDAAVSCGITRIIVHAFLDGRDTPPRSAHKYLQELEKKLGQLGHGIIGSLHGRFYAMDRDDNWERTEKCYRVLTEKQETPASRWQQIIQKNYAHNITDEFIPPTQLNPEAIIREGDGIIFFNFRPDRARQLTQCFVKKKFENFSVHHFSLAFFITPIAYDQNLKTDVLFHLPPIHNTLKDVLSQNGKTIFTIAETEKYAHVTYFFTGGREEILPNEVRILIPSIPAHDYIKLPAMSAKIITENVIKSLKSVAKDFYLINYANADMVGHSGNMEATVKAITCLDRQLGQLFDAIVKEKNGSLYITADHGNAELMRDPKTKQPQTAHTANPVPFLMLSRDKISDKKLPLKQLADIAPFILKRMGLKIPPEMT